MATMLLYLDRMNVTIVLSFLVKALLASTLFFSNAFHCLFSLFVEKQGFLFVLKLLLDTVNE